MRPFHTHEGSVVPLDRSDIDTDQIIPKQFLKRIERTGFGAYLFHDWATRPDGEPNESFELNQPRYRDASILVTGSNFGCGSSREHAPWALADHGFRVIIAPSFAHIFATNCTQNGLLTIELDAANVQQIIHRCRETSPYRLTIDLERCAIEDGTGYAASFTIEMHRRARLLAGVDDIDLTDRFESEIRAFEERHAARLGIA